ncbi:MAG: hypothetical protein HY567_02255 [Candidatus Kerfeldbacteria bacterium]|nr:hypothetical protein [Candidatus Kerfeldbacteria bacterium]
MIIRLVQFGNLLTSRQLGREAFAAFRATLERERRAEPIVVDFEGVTTFSPSWGDEFLGALLDVVDGPLIVRQATNPSVQATLELLEKIYGPRFRREP